MTILGNTWLDNMYRFVKSKDSRTKQFAPIESSINTQILQKQNSIP